MDGKPIITSKTFWFNVIMIVGTLANRNAVVVDPALFEPLAVVCATLGNVVLRWISNDKITGVFK